MRHVLLAIACLLMLLATGVSGAQPDDFSRRDMLESIGTKIILPLNEALVAQSETMKRIAGALRDQPALDTLLAAQAQWRQMMATWRQASLFKLGRMTLVLHSAIESNVPTNVEFIELLVGDSAITLDVAFLETQGSNVTGMGALEYLLFGIDTPPEAQAALLASESGARRLAYIGAITEQLVASCTDLVNYWLPEGDNYLQTFVESDDASDVRESVSMLINALIQSVEMMVNLDIAIPLGLQSGTPAPELIRTPFSDASLALMRSTLEMVRTVFSGVNEPNALGLNALLDSAGAQRGDTPLSVVIPAEIDVVLADIDAIGESPRTLIAGDATPLITLYEDIRTLYLLMKTDMVAQLGLTITFTDGDGD